MTFAQDGIILKGMQGMRLDGSPTSNITLADLEKQRVLGSGATSRVHLVKHRKTGELLALKELMAMADADTRRMAVNELRLASSAHAEHLVRFVDAFFDDGKISILMEFADGGSLDDVIKASGGGVPCKSTGCASGSEAASSCSTSRPGSSARRTPSPSSSPSSTS